MLLAVCLLAACRSEGPSPADLSDDLSRQSLRLAVSQSLGFLAELPADRVLAEWPQRLTAEDLRAALFEFRRILDRTDPADGDRWLEQVAARFDFHPAAGQESGDGPLFTGYYQPVLAASLVETDTYRYPLYGVPAGPDAVNGADGPAAFSRREIDLLGKLAGYGYEIAWLKDPVDRFFLHIQGSGLLELTDGKKLYVGFAASNERPYTSIGGVLIAEGKLDAETLSMQSIRRYLAEYPHEMEELFARNERYIFFRIIEEGPLGSLGVPLTSGRSIATDPRFYPRAGLAFIETEVPVLDADDGLLGWRRTRRFVLNQDTGAAIRGPGRVDLYFGSGARAGAAAGFMNKPGRLYFLVRKAAGERERPIRLDDPTTTRPHKKPLTMPMRVGS